MRRLRPPKRLPASKPPPSVLPVQLRTAHIQPGPSVGGFDRLIRWLNVAVASFALLVTLPLMLLIAALIRMTSPGPVIFKQDRVGIDRRIVRGRAALGHRRKFDRGGRLFTIYKFRTMRTEANASQVWAAKNDARVTSLGRFLRATRLDEIPQFFNVIRGDMNLVGPRPEQPSIFQTLQGQLGHYRERQRVLPGITGLAQIELGYDTDIEGVKKKVALDLEYIRRRSLARDLQIMVRTLPVMILRKVWR